MPEIAPNGAGRCFFPTNPDLADILGDTDFDFDNLYIWYFLYPRFPDSWIRRFLDSQIQVGKTILALVDAIFDIVFPWAGIMHFVEICSLVSFVGK